MNDALYVEINERKKYVNGIIVDFDDLNNIIEKNSDTLITLSILPLIRDNNLVDVKENFDYYENIITNLLASIVGNSTMIRRLEVPFLSNIVINYLTHLNVESLVLLDFSIGTYEYTKLINLLETKEIKKICYLCDNNNNENNRIVNDLSSKFPEIGWGCYFYEGKKKIQKFNTVHEIDILNYRVLYNSDHYLVKILLGNMARLRNNILEFDGLPLNSIGEISKWIINGDIIYTIYWNTHENKDFLVCHEVEKKYKIICNEVIKYINNKYLDSGLTQVNTMCNEKDWNNMLKKYK